MGKGPSEVRRGEERGQYNGSDQNGAKIEMAWGADSVDAGHSRDYGAGRSMSVNLSQVAAAVSSASNLWEQPSKSCSSARKQVRRLEK